MLSFVSRFSLCLIIGVWLAVGAVQAGIKSEKVTYTVGGKEFTGHIAYDDSKPGKRPGVIVVHEWWGHDAYARKRADMLAAEGYTALALDMYGTGRLATHPKDAKAMKAEATATAEIMSSRFLAAYELLKKHPTVDGSKTAAIGYCFGGFVVLNMARAGIGLDAVVSYHGLLSAKVKAKPGGIKAKVRVFNGADDPFVKKEQIEAFKAEMVAVGADYKFVNYPGVLHSFTSEEATARGKKLKLPLKHDAHADKDSWSKTLELFKGVF